MFRLAVPVVAVGAWQPPFPAAYGEPVEPLMVSLSNHHPPLILRQAQDERAEARQRSALLVTPAIAKRLL
jgi:hypothetical protein